MIEGVQVNTFKLKKQFKRRWRRWKRTAWMSLALVAVTILAYSGLSISSHIQRLLTTDFSETVTVMGAAPIEANRSEAEVQAIVQQLGATTPDDLTAVVLEVHYVCGVETEQLGKMTASQVEVLLLQHPEWDAEVAADGLRVKQQVDDLSPLCKEQAYISIDALGNLNLYEGHPTEDKVIRTFFQMDVGSLESSLPEGVWEQLQQGIRVQDKDEYNSVISTFSDYAVDRASEEVILNGG